MNLFAKQLNLWVSLPENDVEMAKAAFEAGADAVKVHIAVEHFASGTHFGTLAEEKERIKEIVRVADGRPVGLVPGESPDGVPADLEAIAALGIAFLSIYAHHCPARWLNGRAPVAVGVAADDRTPTEVIKALPNTGISLFEASIIPRERYGQPVTAADLALYHHVRRSVSLPLVLPSQLKWTPADVPALAATGCNALMIGAIVTGRTVDSLADATAAFRRAIDKR